MGECESYGTEARGAQGTEIWQFLNWVPKGTWRARHRANNRKSAISQAQGSLHTTWHELPYKDRITIHTLLPVRLNWSQPNSLDTHTHIQSCAQLPATYAVSGLFRKLFRLQDLWQARGQYVYSGPFWDCSNIGKHLGGWFYCYICYFYPLSKNCQNKNTNSECAWVINR